MSSGHRKGPYGQPICPYGQEGPAALSLTGGFEAFGECLRVGFDSHHAEGGPVTESVVHREVAYSQGADGLIPAG